MVGEYFISLYEILDLATGKRPVQDVLADMAREAIGKTVHLEPDATFDYEFKMQSGGVSVIMKASYVEDYDLTDILTPIDIGDYNG